MLTRRSFLRTAAVALGGATLAACGATPTATPMPTATKVPPTATPVPVPPTATKAPAAATAAPAAPTAVPPTAVKPTTVPPTPTVAKATITGTFQVVEKQDFFPAMNDWMNGALKQYCKEQGWNAEVNYEAGYVGSTPFLEKLTAASAAGTPPDLMMHDQEITNLQRNGVTDVVNDLVDTISKQWGSPSARQKFDFVFSDKNWYYVPYFQRSDGGWYQDPIFKAKNIDVQKLRLYPELWEACLAVSDPAKGVYGWGTTINPSNDETWFRQRVQHGWGAYVQDETGNYVTVNSPQMVEAVTVITQLYMDKKWAPMLPPGVLSWNDSSNNEAYLAGKLAYTQNGGTVYGKAILDKNPIAAVTRFHPPAGGPVNKEFNSLGANYWAIFKKSKNQAAAKQTILHFCGAIEQFDNILKNAPSFALPAYEKIWDASKYIPTDQVAKDQKPVATAQVLQLPETYPGPANNPPMAAAGSQKILDNALAAVVSGKSTPAQAVKEAHDAYVAVFKQLGKPGTK